MTTDELIIKLNQLSEKYKEDTIDGIHVSSLCQEVIHKLKESDLYALSMKCNDKCEYFNRVDIDAIHKCERCKRFRAPIKDDGLTDNFEPCESGKELYL